ncbi:hypothetical protein [Microbacterium sp. NPDC089696]|uniref:hypothetical protein n=1 Tax=Microbacterium sp. NPDC089696 TaxID=3364199 RepID=UPI0038235755
MSANDGALKLTVRDVPVYPDIHTYAEVLGELHIWEGDGWKAESMSWKNAAYIASNLSAMPEITFRGPDAQELLSRISINNVYKWPIGKSKHLVMPDEHGLIANHGLAIRDAEDTFRQMAAGSWPAYQAKALGLDVEVSFRDVFIYQVAGPASLQILERVIGKDLRDLPFLGIASVEIPGADTAVEIELSRIGMAQTLAYELRGPLEFGPAVYDIVYRAGKEFGIKRLGWRTYVVNHTEGGFPQMGCNFLPSSNGDPGFAADSEYGAGAGEPIDPSVAAGLFTGSIDPQNVLARLRTPQDVNWSWMADYEHDFIGRDAVLAASQNPTRKTVTLVWDSDDVLDVFRSQFEPGEEYRHFEFPTTPASPAGGHADLVTVNGESVGISSVAVYSYYYRRMISHATIDLAHVEPGTEVEIHWGNFGGRIKHIRATVERFPYLDLPSNKDYDLSSVPSGVTDSPAVAI